MSSRTDRHIGVSVGSILPCDHGEKVRVASIFCAGFCGVLVGAATVEAALWLPSTGTSGLVSYTNGQDVNDHFSNPVTGEEKFVFASPTQFVATSPAGPAVVTDTLSFDASVPGGYQITQVSAQISGDYSLSGSPASVIYTATLVLGGGTYTVPILFSPISPVTSGDGDFSGTASIVLPPGISAISVALTGTLQANATTGSTSLVQIKNAQVSFTVIPEPASLGLIGVAVAAVCCYRRRSLGS